MLLAFQAYLAHNRDDPVQAMLLAQQAVEQFGVTKSFFRVYALSFLGQAQSVSGQRRTAIGTLNEAVRLGQKLGNPLGALDALFHLAPLMHAQGRLREALLLCRNIVHEYVDARARPLPITGLAYVPLGALYYAAGDLDSARNSLTTGIGLCQQLGMVYYTVMGQRALAKLQHACREREAAWDTLAAARGVAEQSESPRRRRLVALSTAELQLREGNAAAAARILDETRKPAPSLASEHESLVYARLLLAQHQPGAAKDLLHGLEQAAIEEKFDGSLIEIHVLQALCKQAFGNHSAALERLERAVSLAASGGYRRVFLDEPALAGLLEQVRHVSPSFVSTLLVPFLREPESLPPGDILREPLSKTEREVLSLLSRGLTNQEIAHKLAITVGTTKWHLNHIFGKLHVRNRTEAIAKARDLRVL
jgi:LuxR family maltose regulon positive regulatory protein